jgi:hypothetical protein
MFLIGGRRPWRGARGCGKMLRASPAPLDSYRTKEEHIRPAKPGVLAMSAPSQLTDNSRYEQACDQAIAMCDGNLRSTIKALIMANEYLEAEMEELQAAIAAGCAPTRAFSSEAGTGSREENASKTSTHAGSNAA